MSLPIGLSVATGFAYLRRYGWSALVAFLGLVEGMKLSPKFGPLVE